MLNVTQRLWLPNSNIDGRLNLNFSITFTRNSKLYLHKYTHAIGPFYHSKQVIQIAAAGAHTGDIGEQQNPRNLAYLTT